MDLKPFFLNTTYFETENRDMVIMLWEECLPNYFYSYVKKPENFELLHAQKVTFKNIKIMISKYFEIPGAYNELIQYMQQNHGISRYVYSFLFPRSYMQNNQHGIQTNINFTLCFERWRKKKEINKLAKILSILR